VGPEVREKGESMKVVKARLLIDGAGNPPIKNGVVCIDDSGRICDVGPIDRLQIPPDAEILDWSNYTVLPGLIDSHTHLTLSRRTGKGLVDQLFGTPRYLLAIKAFLNLQEDLRSGVTTMRALGDMEGLEIEVRDAINCGEIPGPRLLACVEIRPSHGTGTTASAADGPWEIRKAVRKGINEGADVIKIFASNIKPGKDEVAYRKGDLTQVAAYTREEIAAAVEEAHRVGVKVAVHAIGGPALRWALEAGANTIEHANLLEERDIELFIKYNAYLSDPNLQLFFDTETGFAAQPSLQGLPSWWNEKVRRARQQTQIVQAEALKAGVKFALGTDSKHGQLWREAMYFVNVLGASEMEAIQSVTKHCADALGLGKEIGTLEKGKIADLVAVDGNPLEDIRALNNVVCVIKTGEVVYTNNISGREVVGEE